MNILDLVFYRALFPKFSSVPFPPSEVAICGDIVLEMDIMSIGLTEKQDICGDDEDMEFGGIALTLSGDWTQIEMIGGGMIRHQSLHYGVGELVSVMRFGNL